jgi:hypothetical protein
LSGERRAKKLVNRAVRKWDHDHVRINEGTDYKEVYPHIWNQYSVYCQAYSIYIGQFNTIAFFASASLAFLAAMAATTDSKLFWWPTPLFVFPLLVSLINLLHKVEIPWVGENKAEIQINKGPNEFYGHAVKDIYYAATSMYDYKETARTWLKASLISVVVGITVAILVAVKEWGQVLT